MQSSDETQRAAGFATYRLPGETICHTICREPETLTDIADTAGRTGFVMSPFVVDDGAPILFFEGEPQSYPTPCAKQTATGVKRSGVTAESDRKAYAKAFSALHGMVRQGQLRKVVLSRSATIRTDLQADAQEMFAMACEAYPTAFVALIATPNNGTWLIATPELLLESHCGRLHTMALAGTMRTDGTDSPKWSDKNRQEQRIVAQYIAKALAPIATGIETSEAETTAAAGLVHLRTTFSFSLQNGIILSDAIGALHPTPAVCGMPKGDAMQALMDHEHYRREYYSGYSGPIYANGDANLYVTLRCAKIATDGCTLFAGGGLMPESREADEWDETEAKMDAMRNIIETLTDKSNV